MSSLCLERVGVQDRIQQLVGEIRESANHNSVQLNVESENGNGGLVDEWVAISLALDTLDDATGALLDYEKHGVGSEVRERFIRIYGMFQSVVLQQQAIARLHEVFVGEFSPPRDSAWNRIIDVYQMAVASPLDGWRPDAKRSRLSQIQVTNDGFYIVTWDRDQWEQSAGEIPPERIYPMALLLEYAQEAIAHLEGIAGSLSGLRP